MNFWVYFAMNTRWICLVLALISGVTSLVALFAWVEKDTEPDMRFYARRVSVFVTLAVTLLLGFAALDAYSKTHQPPPAQTPSFFSLPCPVQLERTPTRPATNKDTFIPCPTLTT